MEALRYCCPASTYTVHCAFPSNFISDSFLIEQNLKPDLTKELEGTNGPIEELHQRFPPAAKVASQIIAAVEKGEFAICEDSIDSALLFANMVGPSPKRGLGIVDTLFGVFMNWIYWPYLRRQWEDICRRDRGDHLT